jgi:hypothetical protein
MERNCAFLPATDKVDSGSRTGCHAGIAVRAPDDAGPPTISGRGVAGMIRNACLGSPVRNTIRPHQALGYATQVPNQYSLLTEFECEEHNARVHPARFLCTFRRTPRRRGGVGSRLRGSTMKLQQHRLLGVRFDRCGSVGRAALLVALVPLLLTLHVRPAASQTATPTPVPQPCSGVCLTGFWHIDYSTSSGPFT